MYSLLPYKDAQLVMGIFITSSFPTDSCFQFMANYFENTTLVSISQLGLCKSANATELKLICHCFGLENHFQPEQMLSCNLFLFRSTSAVEHLGNRIVTTRTLWSKRLHLATFATCHIPTSPLGYFLPRLLYSDKSKR